MYFGTQDPTYCLFIFNSLKIKCVRGLYGTLDKFRKLDRPKTKGLDTYTVIPNRMSVHLMTLLILLTTFL